MKDRRTVIDITDFSGGLVTSVPIASMAISSAGRVSTPDCINVFGEGTKLKKREGISPVNTVTVAAGSVGNGIFNWVISASNQLLMAVFGDKLYKMDSTATTWDGTFDVISAHATSGTPWSSAITHFATYAGTFLMTNEDRTHPQKMTTINTSHFDIESGGSGTAPNGKYIQVWKEHVWILNILAGGALDEDMASISDWTDADVGGGASTQVTTDGLSTMKLVGLSGASASHAIRTRDIGTIENDYVVEIKTNFGLLETVTGTSTSLGHCIYQYGNGVTDLITRFTEDGLQIYDGAAFNDVGVSLVTESVWNVWKFIVTGGTDASATVSVIKDGAYVGVGLDMSNTASLNDGSIDLTAQAGTGTGATAYIDYIKINTSSPEVEYFTDVTLSAWDSGTVPTTPNLVAEPTQPLVHFKLNDDTTSEDIVNNGIENTTANMYANATTVDTDQVNGTGTIGGSITFTSASSHHIRMATATWQSMSDDNVGSICIWLKLNDNTDGHILTLADSTSNKAFSFNLNAGSLVFDIDPAVLNISTPLSTVSSASWTHVVLTQNATSAKFYVNAVETSFTINAGSGSQGLWFNDISDIDNGVIGAVRKNNLQEFHINGDIDDVRYYSSALNGEQIKAIYADGTGTEAQAVTVRQGTTFKIGTFAYEFTNDSVQATGVTQTLASSTALAGVESVVGGWFFVTNLATYKIRLSDGTTDHDSVVYTANGTWQYQTMEFTPASDTTALIYKVISTSAATLFNDQVSIRPKFQNGLDNTTADRIQRSASGTLDDWDGTDSGTNDIVTAKDVGLTGSFIVNDRMYVTKRHSMHRFTYTASTPLVDIKQVRSSIGTSSPRSVRNIVIPGSGEVVIFLGTDRRLYLFDGFDSTPVGTNIDLNNGITSVYLQNINTQALDKVFAVVHDDNPWYEIFVPIGSSTVPDFSIVYDYTAKAFWPMSNRNFRAGTQSDDASGQSVIYVQGNTTGFAYLTNSTNSDSGASITGNWVSPQLGDPTILSRMDEINLLTESVGAQPTLQWRENFNPTYTSVTLASGTNQHNYDPIHNANYIQFKINDVSTDEAFQIWSLRTLNKGLGHAK